MIDETFISRILLTGEEQMAARELEQKLSSMSLHKFSGLFRAASHDVDESKMTVMERIDFINEQLDKSGV